MINRVVLVGRLTRDPLLEYTPNGVAVANFTLACNRNFTNKKGEREADFIRIQVWRKQAENVATYLKKGSMAGVDGRIQTSSYENDHGQRVYVTEVVADSVQFLDSRSSNGSTNTKNSSKGKANASDPFAEGNPSSIDIGDEDLPF